MNRRKQTRPKRTTCPDGVGSVDESSEKLPDDDDSVMCSVNFMERGGGGDSALFPSRRSPPPLMDVDGNFSDNNCEEREEEEARPVARDPPSDDQTLSDPNLDESVPRSPSPRTSDFADRNSLSSPSDIEAADDVDERELVERSIAGGVESISRCADEVKMEKFDGDDVFVRDCPSRSTSVAGSDKDLIVGGVKDPLPPLQVTAADHTPVVRPPPPPPPPPPSGLPSNSPTGKDFITDEQNFVQKLESFVASMDRRTKVGPSATVIPSSSSLEKGTSHHETYRSSGGGSKPLNGVSKHDGGSLKYRFYESNRSRYIDVGLDQPLDLSVSIKDKPNGMTNIDGYDDSLLSIPSRPLDGNSVSGGTGSSSLLASLEKKFGEHSQILDRIGTLPRACHFGGSLALSRGAGFFAPKVSEVSSDQVPGCWKNFSFPSASSLSSSGLHFGDSSRQRLKGRDGAGKTFHSMRESTTTAGGSNVKQGQPPNRDVDAMETKRQKTTTTTSLRCSCNMEFERLFLLTVHLQETGHKPSVVRPDSQLILDNNTKLVRGQDVWLHNGSEQTRQILRCMECHRSFRSLPELTVHMIQTEHYMNLIQPELTPRRVSTEPGNSSSGSEGSPDPFACRFCSKVFEDADALGLHIVASGHYRRDVVGMTKQKQPKIESSSSSSPPSDQPQISSRYSHQNEMKPTPAAAVAAAGAGGVDYAEMLRGTEKAAEGDERRGGRNEDDSSPGGESVEMKKQRKEMMDFGDSSPGFNNIVENESTNEIPTKLPRLDCVIDHVTQTTNHRHSPSSGSSESTLPSVGGGGGGGLFYRPPSSRSLQGPTEMMPEIPKLEPVDESSTRSPPMEEAGGESCFSRAEPRAVVLPGKESALTAMQSFINRSFGHSPKESFRSSQAPDFGRQHHMNQKSSPWQPASNFLTKLTWPEHSPSRSRKRHHNDNHDGGCHREGGGGLLAVENNAESLSYRDRSSDMRSKCDTRQSQSYGDSLFSSDVLWKSRISDQQSRDDRKLRHRESSPCFFPGQQSPFGGGGGVGGHHHHHHHHHQSMVKHAMTSPVVPLSASSPLNEMNSATRKWERLYEKDEKGGRASDRTSEGMSTLDSLQELVYSKSFKTLEKFMHPGPTTTIAYGLGGGGGGPDKTGGHQSTHSLVISTKNSSKKTIPETLILVNPIVTVMPTSSGGGSSLSITLPQSYSSPDSEGPTKDNNGARGTHQSSGSPPSMDATDSDGEQFGEFKCLTCKRNFASKGSYRYHRSRYHAYSDMEKTKMKDQLVTSLCSSHLGSEQTNKFSKYYQLANELSSKSN